MHWEEQIWKDVVGKCMCILTVDIDITISLYHPLVVNSGGVEEVYLLEVFAISENLITTSAKEHSLKEVRGDFLR